MKRLLPAVLWLLAIPLPGQQPPLSETVEVRLIEVDAVVTDREGNPIAGLGPEDFDLFENGRRQVITNFAEYRESEEVDVARAQATPQTQVTVARPQPRTVVLLIDSLPLRGVARQQVFGKLRALVERVMRDGDRAQVLLWHDRTGVRNLSPMTTESAVVEQAIVEAETTLHAPDGGLSVEEQAQWFREVEEASGGGGLMDAEAQIETTIRQSAERDLAIMRRKTAAIQRILSSLAQPSGRSAFVYVSEMFPLIAGKRYSVGTRPSPEALGGGDGGYSTAAMLDAIIRSANTHGVVFYGLRPSVPSSVGEFQTRLEESATYDNITGGSEAAADTIKLQNELDALSTVAAETGGAVLIGQHGAGEAVDRIARDLGSYYTLAYRAPSDGSDRERRIEIRPKNRNHVVRTRRTIVDRSDRSRARDLLVARLFETGPSGDIVFDVAVGPGIPRGSNLLIPVELSIPADQLQFAEEGPELAAKFSVLAVAGRNIGQITKVTEDSRRVAVQQGTALDGDIKYRFEILADRRNPASVSIAVFDETSGLSGTRAVRLDKGNARVETVSNDAGADATWKQALERAERERKPLFVWFRPARCRECASFEQKSINHPTIQRRLQSMVFVTLPATSGEAAKPWSSKESGFALFDRAGLLRVRWVGMPDTTTFGAILDATLAVAPQFEKAVQVAEISGSHEGEIEAAIGLALFGREADARAALAHAMTSESGETRQRATITGALLDARQGNLSKAITALDNVVASAVTPAIAADAWVAIGTLHRNAGAIDAARTAFTAAKDLTKPGSPIAIAASNGLAALQSAQPGAVTGGVIRILPPEQQIVSGRRPVRTAVSSAAVARVRFQIDGGTAVDVDRPPFSTVLDFGSIPERRAIRATAYDEAGAEVGSHEVVVNDAGETFWLRMVEPREGPAGGPTAVSIRLRAPAGRNVRRVVLSWNDEERAVVTAAPWRAQVTVPQGQTGVLRALAELEDGRTAEDAVLLNASGAVEHASVYLVELPLTVMSRGAAVPAIAGTDIIVREGSKRRAVESVAGGSEAPLTVGILIDASASMQKSLPDVQESALRFLDAVMQEGDRAFVVAFNTKANLLQPATSDRAAVRRRIMQIQPEGLTALHDAIALGLLQFEGIKGRRALVVFSDGVDRTSRYRAEDVEDLARRINVPIHLIAAQPVNPSAAALPPIEMPARGRRSAPQAPLGGYAWDMWSRAFAALERMAASTGGSAHSIRQLSELPKVYDRIEAALDAQLLATMRTEPGTRENEWRRIEVEIAGRSLDVHAPEGYYAPW